MVDELALDADQLYTLGPDGLFVFDLSSPSQPKLVGQHAGAGTSDLALENGLIYVDQLTILRPPYRVKGWVADVHGQPVAGINLRVSDLVTATTGTDGSYVAGMAAGTHSLVPHADGFAFWPAEREIQVPPQQYGQSFTLLAQPVTVTLSSHLPGTLAYTDTRGLGTSLHFPAGAVQESTALILTPRMAVPPPGYAFSGHAFELGLDVGGQTQAALQFDLPVEVEIAADSFDLRLVSEPGKIALLHWTGATWEPAAETCPPDAAAEDENLPFQAQICQTGIYALFGPTNQFLLPQVYR